MPDADTLKLVPFVLSTAASAGICGAAILAVGASGRWRAIGQVANWLVKSFRFKHLAVRHGGEVRWRTGKLRQRASGRAGNPAPGVVAPDRVRPLPCFARSLPEITPAQTRPRAAPRRTSPCTMTAGPWWTRREPRPRSASHKQ